MPTPPDDLKPGMYVAIVAYKGEEAETDLPGLFGLARSRRTGVSGQPLRILAVSLPFVAVTDGQHRIAIDVREFDVQRVSRQYAKAMAMPDPSCAHREGLVKVRHKDAQPNEDACLECGCSVVVQRLTAGKGVWKACCQECGREREEKE